MLVPGKQEGDAVVVDQVAVTQEGYDLVAEHERGLARIEVGKGYPVVLVVPAATAGDGMDVRVEPEV